MEFKEKVCNFASKIKNTVPILLRPIFTRMFLFLYLLGIVSSVVTVPNFKGAHMYENAPLELFLDVYVLCALVWILPKKLNLPWLNKLLPKKNGGNRNAFIPLRWTIKMVIYLILYPLYIIDTFCFVKFGSTINPSMLLLIGETNSSEASEFLISYLNTDILFSEVGIVMLVPLVHIICALTGRYVRYGKALKLPLATRIALDLAVFGMLTWTCIVGWENKNLYVKTMSCETIGEVEHSLAIKPCTNMYQPPMRLAFAIRSNQLISQQLGRIIHTTEKAWVDSCDYKSPNIVLIIGESFNKRHAQLYGYDHKNMPNQMRMKKQGFLTPLQDVVSPWNLTSYVFKHLMTTYCVGDEGDWCDYPLFCQLFREAGYNVTFITNQFLPQAKEAVWDFSGGFFLNDSTLSKEQFDQRNTSLHIFDEVLLDDYKDIMEHDGEKINKAHGRLTIFHLMGQHVSYRIRCPNSKKKWGSGDYPNDMDMPVKRRKIMADYDNAVWYNDSVVNQIVKTFKNDNAIIIYLPDHGEEVFGPGVRHFFGRMHDANIDKRLADEEFRIPMWIYCTQKYIRQHRDVYRAVRASANKRYMTDALSHLLLGLAGIHCPYYKPEYDLLSPQYNEKRPRLLKHAVDYDELKEK